MAFANVYQDILGTNNKQGKVNEELSNAHKTLKKVQNPMVNQFLKLPLSMKDPKHKMFRTKRATKPRVVQLGERGSESKSKKSFHSKETVQGRWKYVMSQALWSSTGKRKVSRLTQHAQ